MSRSNLRNLFGVLRELGIGPEPERPRISDDIQLTTQLQGFSVPMQIPPRATPIYACEKLIGSAGFQNHGKCEMLVDPLGAGSWILPIALTGGVYNLWTIAAQTGLQERILPTAANSSAFGNGQPARNICDFGTSVADAPTNSWAFSPETFDFVISLPAIFIGPGRVIKWQFGKDNQAVRLGFLWHEMILDDGSTPTRSGP